MVDYREWLEKSKGFHEEAYEAYKRGRYWLACFHMQQAVKLFLRGLLVREAGSYPFTHSLVELLEALESLKYNVSEEIYAYADALEKHYIRARCPGVGLAVYNERTGKRCLEYGEKIIEYLKEILGREKEESGE
ncbi:MAG: HEPN domain-containing protein [Thermoprotei archaeon]